MKEDNKTLYFPITINKENWKYWWEAKVFEWCFSEGNSLEEYWSNMTDAIQTYIWGVNEGFFEIWNTGVLWINFDNNGWVKSNVLKEFNKNTIKALSYS